MRGAGMLIAPSAGDISLAGGGLVVEKHMSIAGGEENNGDAARRIGTSY